MQEQTLQAEQKIEPGQNGGIYSKLQVKISLFTSITNPYMDMLFLFQKVTDRYHSCQVFIERVKIEFFEGT